MKLELIRFWNLLRAIPKLGPRRAWRLYLWVHLVYPKGKRASDRVWRLASKKIDIWS